MNKTTLPSSSDQGLRLKSIEIDAGTDLGVRLIKHSLTLARIQKPGDGKTLFVLPVRFFKWYNLENIKKEATREQIESTSDVPGK